MIQGVQYFGLVFMDLGVSTSCSFILDCIFNLDGALSFALCHNPKSLALRQQTPNSNL